MLTVLLPTAGGLVFIDGCRAASVWLEPAIYPDISIDHVERIWPVLVTGTGLLMNEALANRIRDELGDHLRQHRVQYLTVLDLADVDQLCALVEQRHSVAEVLRHKIGGYAELDFRRMVHDDPHFDHTARSTGAERRIRAAFAMVGERFGWDTAQVDAMLREESWQATDTTHRGIDTRRACPQHRRGAG